MKLWILQIVFPWGNVDADILRFTATKGNVYWIELGAAL